MIKPGEEQRVAALIEHGFDEFVRDDFTDEGIAEFLRAARAMVFDQPCHHFLMVAESAGQIIGMIDVKQNNHVCLLFVDSSRHRQGIGRQLVDQAIAICRQRKPDLSEIGVHSSLWAVPVYERLGFRQTKPEQEHHGIRFLTMAKRLEPQGGQPADARDG